ncbi:MAG: hypothetical protein BWY26_01319 [Elusimicrobia bacterium ADurb.Bin231]|nr:MAG: hypothetical protein BWY26_01319 [Elusimicrobia bacterium ADurb.Bin231]
METLDRQFHSSIEEESPEELIKLILRFSYYLDVRNNCLIESYNAL